MAENERDITREFLRNIMGGHEEPDQNVINEQTSMPPLDLQSFSEPIEPSAPWPSDGEDRIAAALADHAEELGYIGIPESEWRLEASRLKASYDKKELSVETLEELLSRIEIDYFDEYIEDVAEMYGVDTKDVVAASPVDSGPISERDITKAFLKQIFS